MKNAIQISEVYQSDGPDFKKAMDIYRTSFPANERHRSEIIKERLDKGKYRFFIGKVGQKVVLMATFWDLKWTSFMLFDYMAVDKKNRGNGYASTLLNNIWDILGPTKKSLLLEVEDPRRGSNKAQRKKRVDFYKRHGAMVLNGVRYILPPLSGPDPTDMILMIMTGRKKIRLGPSTVKVLVKKVYRELYGRKGNDPLLKSIVKSIPKNIDLTK